MGTVLIVIHLMVVVALIAMVLLQRSEGGALGMGGGGGGGGFMTARGAANALTRTTAILAAAFFATSIALSIWANFQSSPTDVLDNVPTQERQDNGSNGILDQLVPGGEATQTPADDGNSDSTQVPTGN